MARKDGNIELEGAKFVRKTLKDLMPREATGIARRAVTAVARQVRDTARDHAPKGPTGNLKKSIKSRRTKGGRDEANAAVHVDKSGGPSGKGYHWHLVEFGTRKMSARPYIQPTLAEWRTKAPRVFEQEWWTQFNKEMIKRAKKQQGAKK